MSVLALAAAVVVAAANKGSGRSSRSSNGSSKTFRGNNYDYVICVLNTSGHQALRRTHSTTLLTGAGEIDSRY